MSIIVAPRTITPADKTAITVPIIGELTDLVTDRPGLFRDRPGFIAGGGTDSPLSNAVRAVSRLNCRRWAAADKSNFSTRVNQGNAELCGPYLNSIGEKPLDGDLNPAFTGGQCSGVGYRVRGTFSYQTPLCSGSDPIPGSANLSDFVSGGLILFGPITSARVERYNAGGSCGNNGVRVVVVHSGGTYTQNLFTTTSTRFFRNLVSAVNMERASGSGSCGDPPPLIRPPSTVVPTLPPPPSVTINLPGLPNVEVNVNLDASGDLILVFPKLDVEAKIEVGAEPAGGGGDGGPPPGDVGSPDTPEDPDEDNESSGCAGDGQVLVGLRMELLEAPPKAREFLPGIYRGGAYIYMGTEAGLDQDFAGSQLEDGQFIFAEKDNLTCWKVRGNVGYRWRVTPYYREVET